jgi:hypothetical protein
MMLSKLAIALGVILAGLVTTMSVDAFVAPSLMLQRTVPGAGFDADHQLKMVVNLSHVRAVGKILVPAIPKQEAPINRLSDQFRPRFVAKEFLIGVRYMMRIYTLLVASSLLCTTLRIVLPLPEGMVKFGLSSIGICHQLCDQLVLRARHIAANTLNYSWSDSTLWFVVSLVPFFEELSYRGFGHMLGRFGAVLYFLPFAWLCQWGPWPAAAWCGFSVLGNFPTFTFEEMTISSVCTTLKTLSELALFLPASVSIINMLRKQKEKVPKAEDASTVRNVTSGQKKNAVNIITTLALGKKTKAPLDLERNLEQTFSRSARFHGACEFGAAHVNVQGGLPLGEALMKLQKGFGTFASSLLVESRLVVNRRNLWGAVGAHVAYNSLSTNYCILGLWHFAPTNTPLYLYVFGKGVGLLILRDCLEFLCKIQQTVEDKYLP